MLGAFLPWVGTIVRLDLIQTTYRSAVLKNLNKVDMSQGPMDLGFQH